MPVFVSVSNIYQPIASESYVSRHNCCAGVSRFLPQGNQKKDKSWFVFTTAIYFLTKGRHVCSTSSIT